jgi:hypothetical protein
MPVDRAGILRLRAEEVRTLAESFRTPPARRTLLNIALDYEREAERLEAARAQDEKSKASERDAAVPRGRC